MEILANAVENQDPLCQLAEDQLEKVSPCTGPSNRWAHGLPRVYEFTVGVRF
jgi:hypothetical protein